MNQPVNIVASDVVIEGNLKCSKDLIVDGVVDGEVECHGHLVIGENGKILKGFKVDSVTIYGRVDCDISASKSTS